MTPVAGASTDVQDSDVQGRQLGRRSIVAYGALVVAPDSAIYTPQQLANKLIGIPYFAGTHYLCLPPKTTSSS